MCIICTRYGMYHFEASILIIMLEDLYQSTVFPSFTLSKVNFQISYAPHLYGVPIIPKWFLASTHLCMYIDVEYNLFYHYDD